MCLKKGVKFPNRYDVGHFMLHEPAFALSRKDIHKTVVATGSLICSLVKSRSIMVQGESGRKYCVCWSLPSGPGQLKGSHCKGGGQRLPQGWNIVPLDGLPPVVTRLRQNQVFQIRSISVSSAREQETPIDGISSSSSSS